MNYTFNVNMPTDDPLQGGLGAVWHYLGVHALISFEQPKNDGFPPRTAPPDATHTSCAKVAFVHLNHSFYWSFSLAEPSDSFTKSSEIAVYSVAVQPGDLGDLGGGQIDGEQLDDLPHLGRRNFRTT